jgi:pimeloyl-ACP methyl ester carboxylesterase
MRERRHRWIWLGAAGLALGAAGAAAAAGQRRHMARIAADPENERLRDPVTGNPVGARSRDGTQLYAETFGPDDGSTIVLVHGWTEMLSYWTYVIQNLTSRGFRVVAYDLRGHGQSEQAAEHDYDIARFGEDLEAVIESCVPDGRAAVIAGHSLGAMSIAAWAEHHDVARRAGATALINTGVGDLIAEQLLIPAPRIARGLNKTIAVRGFLGARTPLPRASTPVSYAAARYIAFGPTATPAQVAFYERMLLSCPPDVRASIGIAMSEMELYPALERLTVPTLVIAGEDDRLTPPSHARRIAEMLPSPTEVIVLEDTGHMGPLERPREISEALARLARSVESAADTIAA